MLAAQQPERRDGEKGPYGLGRLPVPVLELGGDGGEVVGRTDLGKPLVHLEPQPFRLDVVDRQVRLDRELDPHLGLGLGRVAAELLDGLADESQVQVEADVGDVARLLATEQVAGATDLEVLERDRHARPEIGVRGHRRESAVRVLGERLLWRVEEVRVAPVAATAHPPPQLVELAQAEEVGALDEQRVRRGDVEAGFDDRRAHQHVGPALPEVDHHLLEVALGHLTVRGRDAGLRYELGDLLRRTVDRLHPVVDEEDLPLTRELAADRGGDLPLVVRPRERQHRVTLFGRRGDDAHLADAGDRHLERARDRGGAHREHVDIEPQLLQLLLVLDAEPLLLVDDDQAEVVKLHLVRQQPVRTDDDVDLAVGDARQRGLHLGVGLEPRQRGDRDREARVPVGERRLVLLDEQRRRDQDRDLLAVLDCLERRTYRDLRLAVADVAAHEPVHRHDLLHVALHLVDADELVGRLDVGERVLQLALPGRVWGERVSDRGLTRRVQLDQLCRDLAYGPAGAGLALVPVGAAHLVERGRLTADVAGDEVELVHRHVQPVVRLVALAGCVVDDQILAGRAGDGALYELDIAPDTVVLVDDGVAGAQLERVDLLLAAARQAASGLVGGLLPGKVGGGVEAQADRVETQPMGEGGCGDRHQSRPQRVVEVLDLRGTDPVLGEHLEQAGGEAVALGGQDDLESLGDRCAQVIDGRLHVAAPRLDGPRRDRPRVDAGHVDRRQVDEPAVL